MVDVAHLRERLESERSELRRQLVWITSEASMDDRSVQDAMPQSGDDEIADTATTEYTRSLDAALTRRVYERINEVEAALQRMQIGQYGMCVNCGREIPAARLEALPWTLYDVECAQQLEVLD